MKKTLLCTVLLGVFVNANAITINSNTSDYKGKIPVVYENKNATNLESQKLLNKTGLFNAKTGSCNEIRNSLKQEVVCISERAGVTAAHIPSNGDFKLSNETPKELSDFIYKQSLGTEGSPFFNRISYVSKTDDGIYRLYMSAYDGSNESILLESRQPILTPTWSPNGRYISYVSFETVRASIIVHDTRTGKRIKVYEARGLNAYPSFKDDRTLLLSLSKERVNSDIYKYDLLTKELVNLTNSKEPEVFPVAGSNKIVFVKMFGDIPYIYEMKDGKTKKLFNSPHNTPSISKDGETIVVSKGDKLVINRQGTLSETVVNSNLESPSISKNGESIYLIRSTGGRAFITSLNRNGKIIFNLKKPNEELIQVSAL